MGNASFCSQFRGRPTYTIRYSNNGKARLGIGRQMSCATPAYGGGSSFPMSPLMSPPSGALASLNLVKI